MLIFGATLSVSNISHSENTSEPTLNNLSPGQRLSALIINRECTKLLRGENFDYAAITQQIDSLPTQSDRNFAKESLEKCFVFAEQKGIRRPLLNVASVSPMGTSVSTSGRGTGNTSSGPTSGTGTSMRPSYGTGTAPGSTRGTGTSASTTGSGSSGPTSGLGSGNGSSRGTGTSGRAGTGTGTSSGGVTGSGKASGGNGSTGPGTGGSSSGTGSGSGTGCPPADQCGTQLDGTLVCCTAPEECKQPGFCCNSTDTACQTWDKGLVCCPPEKYCVDENCGDCPDGRDFCGTDPLEECCPEGIRCQVVVNEKTGTIRSFCGCQKDEDCLPDLHCEDSRCI